MIYVPRRAASAFCDSLDAVYSLFQTVQANFSCPSAVLSSHNLRHESTSRLKQDTEGHYNYSKKFKQPKKCRLDQGRNRRALGSKGDQRKNNKSAHRQKREEESGVKFTTSIKRG